MKSLLTISLFLLAFTQSQKLICQTKNNIELTMSPIDTFIEKKMNETGIVGIGAATIIDKELVWTKGRATSIGKPKNLLRLQRS